MNMKLSRFSFCIIFLILFFFGNAQSTRGIQWSKNGSSYYAIDGNTIVQLQLPLFQQTLIADTLKLVPKGQARALRIRSFSLSDDEKKILIYTNSKKVWRLDTRGDYWLLDLTNNRLTQLGKSLPASSLMFAKISPDGKKAAYVSQHNIYVEDLVTNQVTRLTTDGTERLINGTFDWAYEEEFDCRDGFRWSPDSRSIAYWQIDARTIKNFLLINNTDSLYSFVVPIEYPKVGQDPSSCRIGVVNVQTKKTRWMQVPGDSRQHYIPRMEWAANSSELVLEQLNRKQNQAKVFLCTTATGAVKEIYSEQNNAWIDIKARWSNEASGWEWINGGKEFLWVSEKDGWRHIFKVDRHGKEMLLTKGDYDMIDMKAIDEKNGFVYFTASPENATQQYLYRVSMNAEGQLQKISPATQKGTHNYTIAPNAQFAIHSFSNIKNERLTEWVKLPAQESFKTTMPNTNTTSSVQMFQITTDDGVTMDGWMSKPKNFDSTKKYPVVFNVYAEPAGLTVRDAAGSASTSLYAGDMAADGYLYMSVE